MTLWAFVSDVHGRGDRLARVLADIQSSDADRIIGLGDIASANALALLDRANAACVFGNWEASGLRGLPAPYRGWVSRWPARLGLSDFLGAHATPVWPAGLTIGGVVDYLRIHKLRWTELFPSLQRSDEARLAAFAELAAAALPVFFHGHTHVQEAWRLREGEAPRWIGGEQKVLHIDDGARWLVGVGSVGEPHDGPGASYALYDDQERTVTWRRA
jgi:predicted phosphodiesterase